MDNTKLFRRGIKAGTIVTNYPADDQRTYMANLYGGRVVAENVSEELIDTVIRMLNDAFSFDHVKTKTPNFTPSVANAWVSSLEKGIKVLSTTMHQGDEATLQDIINYINHAVSEEVRAFEEWFVKVFGIREDALDKHLYDVERSVAKITYDSLTRRHERLVEDMFTEFELRRLNLGKIYNDNVEADTSDMTSNSDYRRIEEAAVFIGIAKRIFK